MIASNHNELLARKLNKIGLQLPKHSELSNELLGKVAAIYECTHLEARRAFELRGKQPSQSELALYRQAALSFRFAGDCDHRAILGRIDPAR